MAAGFISIDLETANSSPWSICQIGVAEFFEGKLTREWMTYIDPEERFDRDNVAVHGITSAAVQGWPRLAEVTGRLREMLNGRIVVSHSPFDRVALEQAFDRQRILRLNCSWLDSVMVARRAWKGFERRGFGLENLCRILGYRYQSHDALCDARAAGVVVLAAIEQTGVGLERWLRQVELPLGEGPRQPIRALTSLPPGSAETAPRKVNRPANRVLGADALRLLTRNAEHDTKD